MHSLPGLFAQSFYYYHTVVKNISHVCDAETIYPVILLLLYNDEENMLHVYDCRDHLPRHLIIIIQ